MRFETSWASPRRFKSGSCRFFLFHSNAVDKPAHDINGYKLSVWHMNLTARVTRDKSADFFTFACMIDIVSKFQKENWFHLLFYLNLEWSFIYSASKLVVLLFQRANHQTVLSCPRITLATFERPMCSCKVLKF